MNRTKSLFVLFGISLILAGCGGQVRPTMPVESEPVAIKINFLKLGLNRPFGSYEMKGSSFIVGKYTKITTGEAGLAVAGVISAHHRGKKAAKKVVDKHEALLKYDLVSEVNRIVKKVATKWRGHTRLDPTLPVNGNAVMELEPWVYIGASDDGERGTVSVYLRARLKDKSGKKVWRGGYNYTSPVERPFSGRGGWFANNGHHLKSTVNHGYRTAASVMMKDSQGSGAGWGNEAVKIRVAIPGGQKPLKLDAVILKRSKSMIIYAPKTAQAAFIYGVNIVPKNSIEILQQ